MAKYTNSPLVGYTGLVNKHSGQRTHCIDRITPPDSSSFTTQLWRAVGYIM